MGWRIAALVGFCQEQWQNRRIMPGHELPPIVANDRTRPFRINDGVFNYAGILHSLSLSLLFSPDGSDAGGSHGHSGLLCLRSR